MEQEGCGRGPKAVLKAPPAPYWQHFPPLKQLGVVGSESDPVCGGHQARPKEKQEVTLNFPLSSSGLQASSRVRRGQSLLATNSLHKPLKATQLGSNESQPSSGALPNCPRPCCLVGPPGARAPKPLRSAGWPCGLHSPPPTATSSPPAGAIRKAGQDLLQRTTFSSLKATLRQPEGLRFAAILFTSIHLTQ